MKNKHCLMVWFQLGLLLAFLTARPSQVIAADQGIVVDHTCTDLSKIPPQWIEATRDYGWNFYYMYRSHGHQIAYGFGSVAATNANCAYVLAEKSLPSAARSINIFSWYEFDGSALQDHFWDGAGGRAYTRGILTNNPSINLALWASSGEGRDWNGAQVTNYLTSMELLENEFTNVTFIYQTFNTQPWDDGGTNRHHTFNDSFLVNANADGAQTQTNNQIIRKWCLERNKVLFDFGDIDTWYGTNQAFSTNAGQPFPHEHPHYNLDQDGHTSYENCFHKGVAMWWLIARLSGWPGPTGPTLQSTRLGDGRFQFEMTGDTGGIYEIQSTIDFMSWTTNGIVTNVTGTASFIDPNAVNFSKRFYRAVAK